MRQGLAITLLGRMLFVLRIANWASALFFLVVLASTLPFPGMMEAMLTAKYGARIDVQAVLWGMRLLVIGGLVGVYLVHRLLSSLSAIVCSVQAGNAFASGNAERLRAVGWSLLALQILDLLGGPASWWFAAQHVDFIDWTPSVIGWLGVIVAFVLAQVFADGAAMRDDIEGTV
jgi:hypothetical protein